ncbi:MAG: formylglycine-generating enzyme family protein [Alistipes sp.]
MKNYRILSLCSLLWLLFAAGAAHAQKATNVDCEQHGSQIVVTYTLDRVADIEVYCSEDGGATFGPQLQKVTGDVGAGVSPGNKRLTWDVTAEREQLLGDRIVIRVTAVATPAFCELVFVKGGTFTMGATSEQGYDALYDEKPAHQVTVSDFSIGKYEVTQAQWEAVMGSNPSLFEGDNRPVEQVNWDDIQEFLRKLNAQSSGRHYRLPTEAEWEYAARGGKQSRGYEYSGSNDIDAVAWYNGNADSKTHPVGQKSPNELGIYDMAGNVWEWCQDWYGDYSSSSQSDPTGPSSGSHRVLRGGCWCSSAQFCRVSIRYDSAPDSWNNDRGFRVVSF